MKRMFGCMAGLLVLVSAVATAEEPRPYTEGAVVAVTSVKVMDGQFGNYMAFLEAHYKPELEAEKKAGVILDYSVYATQARRVEDPDLYLVVTYPNMAAFDGLDDRTDPIAAKVSNMNRSQAEAASGKRTAMRTIMGTELIRELKLK